MNQDLKYAADNIMQIAQQAIRSIEMLYSQNTDTMPTSSPSRQTPVFQQQATTISSAGNEFADYPNMDYNTPIPQDREIKPMTIPQRQNRPQNIDNNLQEILL